MLEPLPTDITVALDAAYDSDTTRTTLADRDFHGQIAHKRTPAPIQATSRWPVERTHAWATTSASCAGAPSATRRSCSSGICLAHAIITLGRLIRQAWTCYRWTNRPRRRP
jgi:hypothetical protein